MPQCGLLGKTMRAAVKCIHPLLLAGIALFFLPLIALPGATADIIPSDKAGPCSVPVFLLFVPGEFMILLGLGFSAIRLFELRAARRKISLGGTA
jgi:hypothetical protein